MASLMYNGGKKNIGNAAIAFLTDTIKVALLTSAYTPDKDAHVNFSDVVAQESSGTGYTTGGATTANKTVTQDNTNDRAVFDFDDVSWLNSTIPDARWACIYQSTGNNATSKLIAVIDLLATKNSVADTFKIEWDAAGVFYLA